MLVQFFYFQVGACNHQLSLSQYVVIINDYIFVFSTVLKQQGYLFALFSKIFSIDREAIAFQQQGMVNDPGHPASKKRMSFLMPLTQSLRLSTGCVRWNFLFKIDILRAKSIRKSLFYLEVGGSAKKQQKLLPIYGIIDEILFIEMGRPRFGGVYDK